MNLNRTMYPPVNNSVPTTLTSAISATDTVINVANAAVLPDAPNLVSIGGQDDNVEVVLYGQKSGNTLSQCLRGHNGTVAQPWAVGTLAYRAMTAYDLTAGQENIAQLNTGKLDVDGDASNVKATFAQAATRGTINTGSTLGTLFGILKKWYADFRDGAWAAFGTGNGDIARGDHNHNGVYLTAETDPTVPAWAKAAMKPTYGVAEISGAVPDTRTINGKALNANVTLGPADVAAVAKAGDTMTGQLVVGNPAIGTVAVRNISAGTADLTPGVSALAAGTIYLVHE